MCTPTIHKIVKIEKKKRYVISYQTTECILFLRTVYVVRGGLLGRCVCMKHVYIDKSSVCIYRKNMSIDFLYDVSMISGPL